MSDAFLLFPISTFASIVTAAVGLGGGLALLAIIPFFVPIAAVVPIQGVVNLGSNFSRFVVDWKLAVLTGVVPYIVGGLAGTLFGWPLIGKIPDIYLYFVIGTFILFATWTDLLKLIGRQINNNFLISGLQGFLALFVGSTAPLSISILLKQKLTRDQVIVTNAMQMSILNVFRIAAFFLAGFSFRPYLPIIVSMVAGSFLGSFLGSKMRTLIPEQKGLLVLKIFTSILAAQLIIKGLLYKG